MRDRDRSRGDREEIDAETRGADSERDDDGVTGATGRNAQERGAGEDEAGEHGTRNDADGTEDTVVPFRSRRHPHLLPTRE